MRTTWMGLLVLLIVAAGCQPGLPGASDAAGGGETAAPWELAFVRSGGIDGREEALSLSSSGTGQAQGSEREVAFEMPPEELAAIRSLVGAADFFNQADNPPKCCDRFQLGIAFQEGDRFHAIVVGGDGDDPRVAELAAELVRILDEVLGSGVRLEIANLDLLGRLSEPAQAVAAHDGLVYVGSGPRLLVVDTSDPATPRVSGRSDPLPEEIQAIAVRDGHAFVAAGRAGLRVIDVSDAAAPAEVAALDLLGAAHGIGVQGAHAYVAAGAAGLVVVEVSDPAHPVQLAAYPERPRFGGAGDVHVSGGYAYVVTGGGGLRVVDVSDPAGPVEVGAYNLSRGDVIAVTPDVFVTGGRAYLAAGSEGLHVLDLKDPARPGFLGRYRTRPMEWIHIVHVVGARAYLAGDDASLRVVDVSDPGDPVEVATYQLPEVAEDVLVSGSQVLVAAGDGGLLVLGVPE